MNPTPQGLTPLPLSIAPFDPIAPLKSRAREYQAAFGAADARDTYRQLLIQLSQIVRVPVSTFDPDSQPSLEPLHRSEGTPIGRQQAPAQYGKQ